MWLLKMIQKKTICQTNLYNFWSEKNQDKFLPPLLLFTGSLLLAPVINFGIPSNVTIRVCL